MHVAFFYTVDMPKNNVAVIIKKPQHAYIMRVETLQNASKREKGLIQKRKKHCKAQNSFLKPLYNTR